MKKNSGTWYKIRRERGACSVLIDILIITPRRILTRPIDCFVRDKKHDGIKKGEPWIKIS